MRVQPDSLGVPWGLTGGQSGEQQLINGTAGGHGVKLLKRAAGSGAFYPGSGGLWRVEVPPLHRRAMRAGPPRLR